MADKEKVKKRLDKVVEKLAEIGPDVAEGWGGTILFKCPDLETGWMMKMSMDGTVESLIEKVDEEAASSIVVMNSDVLIDVFNGDIIGMEAYTDGRMRVIKSLQPLIQIIPPCIGPVD